MIPHGSSCSHQLSVGRGGYAESSERDDMHGGLEEQKQLASLLWSYQNFISPARSHTVRGYQLCKLTVGPGWTSWTVVAYCLLRQNDCCTLVGECIPIYIWDWEIDVGCECEDRRIAGDVRFKRMEYEGQMNWPGCLLVLAINRRGM